MRFLVDSTLYLRTLGLGQYDVCEIPFQILLFLTNLKVFVFSPIYLLVIKSGSSSLCLSGYFYTGLALGHQRFEYCFVGCGLPFYLIDVSFATQIHL